MYSVSKTKYFQIKSKTVELLLSDYFNSLGLINQPHLVYLFSIYKAIVNLIKTTKEKKKKENCIQLFHRDDWLFILGIFHKS